VPTAEHARLPFAEQVAFFRGKLGNLIPTERWDDVWQAQHDRGWMVAAAQKADLLADMAGAVERVIADGKSIDWFRQQFDRIVGEHGWAYRGERNWRTRTIYRTNMATSYAAGRLAQLRDPELQRLAPYWLYRHNDSVLTPRPLHVAWDGLVLPADHPWFRAHYPPNGWGCQCRVVAVTEGQARRQGRLTTPPDDGVQPDGTPNGIGRGWDYMPGDTVADDIRRTVADKADTLPGGLGNALRADTATIPPAPQAPA
jgi:hypothetical protein